MLSAELLRHVINLRRSRIHETWSTAYKNNPKKYELETLLLNITDNKTKLYSAKLKKISHSYSKNFRFAGFIQNTRKWFDDYRA